MTQAIEAENTKDMKIAIVDFQPYMGKVRKPGTGGCRG